jgi:hypothetical protein
MARKRLECNALLPPNVRCRDGYYSWRNPIDGREIGLGHDRAASLKEAARRNELVGRPIRIVPGFALSKDEIVFGATTVSALCAIYFLIAGCEIVYIGQSTNVHKRIATHLADGVIAFDRYFIQPCDRSLLDLLETQFICEFKPVHNKTFNHGTIAKICTG